MNGRKTYGFTSAYKAQVEQNVHETRLFKKYF